MHLPDLINGLFETCGGVAIWGHVAAIRRDKKSRGVSSIATWFFASWGLWNLFYYPDLGQWLSFCGGLVIVAGNCTWIYYMWKYRNA